MSAKKRLLIGAMHFAYLKGGGEHYPLNLAEQLAPHFEVEFMLGRDPFLRPSPLSRRFPLHYVPFLYVLRRPGERLKGKVGMLLRILHYLPYTLFSFLYLLAARRRYTLVNAHEVLSLLAAVLVKKLRPIPVVATLHGKPGKLEYWLLRQVEATISVNEIYKEELTAAGIQNVTTIPAGVDFSVFYPSDQAEARERLGLPGDRRVLLFAGRLIPLKNVGHLIRAVEELRSDYPDVLLAIVGEGVMESKLKETVQSKKLEEWVRFFPSVPQGDLRHYYAAADLLLLPSTTEAFPMVGVEAMACGLPVLMTKNSPGFRRAFPEEIVPTIDPQDVGQTVSQVKKMFSEDRAIRRRQVAEAVAGYGWQVQAEKTLTVFEHATASSR